MESKRNFIYYLRNLRNKHRLSLKNQHDGSEVWYMYISPLNAFAGFLALILILFVIISITVAYTPVLDLIPGYPGNKSRKILIENILRLDSMERELISMKEYSDNISLIMEGKTPVMRNLHDEIDSMRDRTLISPSTEDSVLRAQMESSGIYGLNTGGSRRSVRESLELTPPVDGVVSERFDPKKGIYGTGITVAVQQPVAAVYGGTVISDIWTPDEGHIVQIQHPNNLISTYKRMAQVITPVGTRVKSGEIIGYTADNSETGNFFFELWNNGSPVDPEGFITF